MIPKRRSSQSLCLVALATATAYASTSRGADVTEPIRIEYRTQRGAGCPSEKEFEAQVFTRTARARPAADGESARTFIVQLRRKRGRIAGSLVVREPDGATMARRVSGSECTDVARVLALATALAIDPRAELAPRQSLDEPRDSTDRSEPDTGREPDDSPEADAARGRSPVASPNSSPNSSPTETPPTVPAIWSARWAFGASVAFAVTPRPPLGASALLSLARRGAHPLGELGLELAYRRTSSGVVRNARAAFQFYVARPTLCAPGINLAVSLLAAPCVVFEAGAVTGAGSRIPDSERQIRFWATAEVLLRLELALGEDWFATLEGGAASPLTRYQFVFRNPDTSIYEVPALAATGALRVGSNF